MSYNGWKNYETWAVKLWIDNEQISHEYWQQRARELLVDARKSEILTEEQTARYDLADELQRTHQQNRPEVTGVYADLLTAALGEVDWDEIATAMITDAKEALIANGELPDAEHTAV